MTYDMLNVSGEKLGELMLLVSSGKVGRVNAKKILTDMFDDNTICPEEYAKANGYIISNDTSLIETVVKKAVEANPKAVADFKSGKEKAILAIFGACMKELKGNCSPDVLREILIKYVDTL